MKLFGKKDDTPTDAPELDAPGETMEDGDAGFGDPGSEEAPADAPPADMDEAAVPDDGELSAPARPAAGAGGGRKKVLVLLGVLVALIAAGGGGYFYLQTQSDTAPLQPIPPRMAAQPATPPAMAAATAPVGVPPQPVSGVPPQPVSGVPPQPAPGAPAAAATTPVAGAPANPAVAALGPPPSDESSAIPLTAATAPAAAPAIAGAPAAAVPAGTAAPAAPAAAASAVPAAAVPVATKTPPALAGAAPPGIEAPAEETPQDLPMPVSQTPPPAVAAAPVIPPVAAIAAMPAPATPAANSAAATKTAKAPAGKTTEPSEAEKAIVQNAAVLDQLSTNAQPNRPFDPNQAPPDQAAAMKTVDQLLEQSAVVRPLPPAWLTVKKERDSDDVDTRLTLAREALSQNNNTAALQLFTELRAKYPKDKRVLMGRAVALQKLGQGDAALSAYEAVLNSDPKNLEALTNMLGLLKKKDPSLAAEKLEELHEAYPYNADIVAQLGVACGAAGRYADSMKYLDMAEALDPGSLNVIYNKAVLYDHMGKSQQAGDLYREVIRMAADGGDQQLPMDAIKKRLAVLR